MWGQGRNPLLPPPQNLIGGDEEERGGASGSLAPSSHTSPATSGSKTRCRGAGAGAGREAGIIKGPSKGRDTDVQSLDLRYPLTQYTDGKTKA